MRSALFLCLLLPEVALASAFSLAKPDANFVYSPYGVESVCAMVSLGARGDTATELNRVFPDLEKPGLGLAPTSGAGFRFTIANSAWIKKDYPVLPAFTTELRTKFGAEITPLDFAFAAADAAQINGWVEKRTDGMIPKLISPDAIRPDLRLILVNALYFKAKWEIPFKPHAGRVGDFHPIAGAVYKTDFMHETAKFRVLRRNDSDVLILPYAGGQQSLWLVLPHAGTALATLEPSLDEAALEKRYLDDRETAKEVVVALSLPKFSIESDLKLVPYLEERGVKKLFSADAADLSGISASPPKLYVGDVIQHAKIDLDEAGTEAAAATAGMVMAAAVIFQPNLVELRFDRPFAYFLRDETTGKILFLGRLARAPAAVHH